LIDDILISKLFNKPVFTWGKSDLSKKGDTRKKYLEAIYNADKELLQSLIDFSRT
jgi:hypothetical protein